MPERVIILGGGVGGLSAVHELVERGFEVEIHEPKGVPGGKARSIYVTGTGTGGRPDLPGEHGFRFFPGFYKHLPDTMKRIPFEGKRHGVFDNLVQATEYLLNDAPDKEPVLLTRYPVTPDDHDFPFTRKALRGRALPGGALDAGGRL
jgi:15-cis-phytoene desaturase